MPVLVSNKNLPIMSHSWSKGCRSVSYGQNHRRFWEIIIFHALAFPFCLRFLAKWRETFILVTYGLFTSVQYTAKYIFGIFRAINADGVNFWPYETFFLRAMPMSYALSLGVGYTGSSLRYATFIFFSFPFDIVITNPKKFFKNIYQKKSRPFYWMVPGGVNFPVPKPPEIYTFLP